jgi:hypothetical protein
MESNYIINLQVTIKQRYENKESDPVEAQYDFPLDSRACVTQFWAEIDGKTIMGSIKEKEKAKEIYDDAIASGNGAYLLEQGSIFQLHINAHNRKVQSICCKRWKSSSRKRGPTLYR